MPSGDPKKRRVCFSFAAYAKSAISHLRTCGVPVTAGLTDLEFTAIEVTHAFSFPPDLRSVLREGLPVGPGFPNWRSSSPQQLRNLLDLPISSILNEVANGRTWCNSWTHRPESAQERVDKSRAVLEASPRLVPIYRNYYIPSVKPDTNGSPIFLVRGGEVKCWGLDIADFFSRFDANGTKTRSLPMPTWAAKSARRVDTWSDLAGGENKVAGGVWEEMGVRLREGGWREEEVREMLEMDGGYLVLAERGTMDRTVLRDRESVMRHVRLLALALLKSGWSAEDVVYAMGSSESVKMEDISGGNEISIEL